MNLRQMMANIISSIPSLSLNSLLETLSFTLTLHIHLTILISGRTRTKNIFITRTELIGSELNYKSKITSRTEIVRSTNSFCLHMKRFRMEFKVFTPEHFKVVAC